MEWHGKLNISSGPAVEPVTTAETKLYCRIDHSDEDTLIAGLIKTARTVCENYTNRQLITATLNYNLDQFPAGRIYLPKPPLQSITSIQYYDVDGASQTLSASLYQVDTKAIFGSAIPAYGESWPSTETGKENAITITYKAGFGDATTNIPETLRIRLMDYVAYLYEKRGTPGAIEPPDLDEFFGADLAAMAF